MPGHSSTKSPARRKPLLCLLNVRHHWHEESTPDGERYVRCTKCGKDKDEYPNITVEIF
jgi:hypothetical protein